jgi:hypothetical protein
MKTQPFAHDPRLVKQAHYLANYDDVSPIREAVKTAELIFGCHEEKGGGAVWGTLWYGEPEKMYEGGEVPAWVSFWCDPTNPSDMEHLRRIVADPKGRAGVIHSPEVAPRFVVQSG